MATRWVLSSVRLHASLLRSPPTPCLRASPLSPSSSPAPPMPPNPPPLAPPARSPAPVRSGRSASNITVPVELVGAHVLACQCNQIKEDTTANGEVSVVWLPLKCMTQLMLRQHQLHVFLHTTTLKMITRCHQKVVIHKQYNLMVLGSICWLIQVMLSYHLRQAMLVMPITMQLLLILHPMAPLQ